MKYKILCTDGFAKAGLESLNTNPLFEVTFIESLTHEELKEKIGAFDGLIVRSASQVSEDIIDAAPNLKIIARAGIGTDNIDSKAATKRGIMVVNAPSGNTISTAELSFAMLLSLARHIPQASKSMHDGKWEKSAFKGTELALRTLGVIGLGRVGREVVKRALAFKMKVLGFDPFLNDDQFGSIGVAKANLEKICKESDFITIHTPLTKETKDLITLKEMKMMKPSTRLINCARGGVINEKDLATALQEKIIAGAALDVFSTEPFEDPMFKGLPNCIMTPHLGASTNEAQNAVAVETAESVTQFFTEGRGYFLLAEKLGILAAGLADGKPVGVTLCAGEKKNELLMLSVLKGLLGASFTSATAAANQRGIGYTDEIATCSSGDEKAIGVRLATDKGSAAIWGTVITDGSFRVVQYNDYILEIEPAGTLLFIQNDDKPGVIGKVSSILGEKGVNISEMQNVRKKKGADALTVISVDDVLDANILKTIEDVDGVKIVKQVAL